MLVLGHKELGAKDGNDGGKGNEDQADDGDQAYIPAVLEIDLVV